MEQRLSAEDYGRSMLMFNGDMLLLLYLKIKTHATFLDEKLDLYKLTSKVP